MSVRELLKEFKENTTFTDCVTRWETISARDAQTVDFPAEIDATLKESLEGKGIQTLYLHQRQAYEEVRKGCNIVVVTPTASGKSLCYNLPVLQALRENPDIRSLYIFPTKALAQDQQSDINGIILENGVPVKVATYDGDTPTSLRASARETGQIIISNPDMLHSGVLPNHPKWIKFFKNLKYIVLDEIHTYRGVFGSHVTNVIRRLKRICGFYGSKPVFICCSATIGNPAELAESIIEEPVVLVDENGAPSGEKHFILYNPPLVDKVQGIRRGITRESQKIAIQFLKGGVKTIVFARSRVRTELIASYMKQAVRNMYNENSGINIESYRGGYLPMERRAIEKGLRDGTVHGVVSTNALELGIDIGGIDAAVLAGFPGSISSSWQQAGRAGRRHDVSAAVLIASASPLDQFMVSHPDFFLQRPPESAYIDPDNAFILLDHLKCAVFEMPMDDHEQFGEYGNDLLSILEEEGTVRHTGGKWFWSERGFPAESVSLRSATSENIVIIDTTTGKNEVIGEMDRVSAKELLFPNAVYIHRSIHYFVLELNLEEQCAYVQQRDIEYYTDALVKRDIKVLEEFERTEEEAFSLVRADILVRSNVAKFKKLRFHTHENIGYGEIFLPEEEMHTSALAMVLKEDSVPGKIFQALGETEKSQVILRLGKLIQQVAPVYLLCDTRDIGISERVRDPHFQQPALYIFDPYPGGSGLVEKIIPVITKLFSASRSVVENCGCSGGCPSCIGPHDDEEEITVNPKKVIADFLTNLSYE